MSVRFTSGGVGRFGFDEANATLDAADAMVGRFGDAGRPIDPTQPRPIVARLTTDHGEQLFEPGPKGIKYRVWSWSQVRVGQGAAKKKIETSPNGKASAKFGEMPSGRAVQLGGRAIVGETVILFRLMSNDGQVWFCFSGRPSIVGTTSPLRIVESIEVAEGIFSYQVEPVFINTSRGLTPNTDLPAGVAFNAYEISDRHDQPLIFDNPPSRMEVIGPVKGPVVGILASAPDQPTVWMFEAPSPLRPVCGGPVPGAFGQLLNGGF